MKKIIKDPTSDSCKHRVFCLHSPKLFSPGKESTQKYERRRQSTNQLTPHSRRPETQLSLLYPLSLLSISSLFPLLLPPLFRYSSRLVSFTFPSLSPPDLPCPVSLSLSSFPTCPFFFLASPTLSHLSRLLLFLSLSVCPSPSPSIAHSLSLSFPISFTHSLPPILSIPVSVFFKLSSFHLFPSPSPP